MCLEDIGPKGPKMTILAKNGERNSVTRSADTVAEGIYKKVTVSKYEIAIGSCTDAVQNAAHFKISKFCPKDRLSMTPQLLAKRVS